MNVTRLPYRWQSVWLWNGDWLMPPSGQPTAITLGPNPCQSLRRSETKVRNPEPSSQKLKPLHLHLPLRLLEVCSGVLLLRHFNLDSYQSVISILSTRTDRTKA